MVTSSSRTTCQVFNMPLRFLSLEVKEVVHSTLFSVSVSLHTFVPTKSARGPILLWYLLWNFHFSLHPPLSDIHHLRPPPELYFNIQLHMIFKYKICLFVFSLQRAFQGVVALLFFNFNIWLNYSISAQMFRENGRFFLIILTDLAFLVSWIVEKGTIT